jgi:GTP1/Obg family GTP-binding protein
MKAIKNLINYICFHFKKSITCNYASESNSELADAYEETMSIHRKEVKEKLRNKRAK